jgi:hypothetical protein
VEGSVQVDLHGVELVCARSDVEAERERERGGTERDRDRQREGERVKRERRDGGPLDAHSVAGAHGEVDRDGHHSGQGTAPGGGSDERGGERTHEKGISGRKESRLETASASRLGSVSASVGEETETDSPTSSRAAAGARTSLS